MAMAMLLLVDRERCVYVSLDRYYATIWMNTYVY